MNITEFKQLVTNLPLNKTERSRANNLTASTFKFLCRTLDPTFSIKAVNNTNWRNTWHKLNQILAKEDKFHRIQSHNMRHCKDKFIDYSDLAYNGVADDL